MPGPNAARSPRRAMSGSVTVEVTANTPLKSAAAATASGSFNLFLQNSFWERSPHPLTGSYPAGNFFDANPGEDAANSTGHTHIDYGGKWCYDPVRRKGMFLANGANPVGQSPNPSDRIRIYSYVWNTLALYDEQSNTWSTQRAVKCPDEGADPDSIVHILHNNTIDAAAGILYKMKFRGSEGIMRYNIGTNTFLNTIGRPPLEPSAYGHDGGLEWIPTRGASGALWCFHADKNNNTPMISEYNIATGVWSTLLSSAGSQLGTRPGDDIVRTMAISYNPRAFGGAGGVLVGSIGGNFKVNCSTLAISSAGTGPRDITPANGLKLCADPVGTGWYYADNSVTGYMYFCDGSTWTQVAQLPSDLGTPGNIYPAVLCPIHREGASDYGVIWLLAGQLPSRSATNGMGSWLFKP
jgi:hypothetical protein